MSGSEATMQAYGGAKIEFTTASGATVRGRCLTLDQTFRILELYDAVERKEPGALKAIVREFTEAAGIGDARVTHLEVFREVIPYFLFPEVSESESPTEVPAPTPTEPSAGTT